MNNILRIDAFAILAHTIDKEQWELANQMLRIIFRTISNDKKNNAFSNYIYLNSSEEELLFYNNKLK